MTDFSRIPNAPHYCIIKERSIYIPGDERSRTAPGHGYPAHTESSISYQTYADKDDWIQEIKGLTFRKESFRAFFVKPARIETVITVEEDN